MAHDYAKRKFQLKSTSPFDEKPSLYGTAGNQNSTTNSAENVKTEEDAKNEEDADKFKKLLTHTLCFVFRSQLTTENEQHSLLYAADMECFENFPSSEQTDSDLIRSVVLRTAKTVKNAHQAHKLKKYKTMKWYCHSQFTGNTKFAIASWSENHIANEIKEKSLDDLIEMGGGEWNKDVCLYQVGTRCNILINFKTDFKQNQPNESYRNSFRFNLLDSFLPTTS